MKKLYIMCALLLVVMNMQAQHKWNTISATTGLSLYNTKNFNLQVESIGNKTNSIGFIAENILYGGEDAEKYNFKSKGHVYYSGGLFYKYSHSSRNFYQNFKAGALAGIDHCEADAFVWYPFIQLEQSFYLQPNLQIFIGERCTYMLNYADRNFQPALQCGAKFSL